MKKLLFTFFAIMLLGTSGVWGAEATANKHVSELITMHSWVDNANPLNSYRTFTLDDVISISATHKDNSSNQTNGTLSGTRWFMYQNDNNGQFTISAKRGYQIKTVYFEYGSSNGAVVSTKSGKSVAESYRITDKGTPKTVNSPSIVLYIGNTGNATGGMAKITRFTVVYSDVYPTSITLPEKMTVAVGNTFQIGQVVPTYSQYTWSTTDKNIVDVDINGVITAKTTGTVTISVKGDDNKIQKSCEVKVVAGGGNTWQETFSKAGIYNTDQTRDVVGDSSVYNWTLTRYQRQDAAGYKVDGKIGLYFRYNGTTSGASIASKGKLEGGIKAVAFKWKPANNANEVHFMVNAGGTDYVYNSYPQTSTWYSYQREFEVKENASFSISLEKQRTPQQAYMYFGPVTITPYLLYTNKNVDATDGFYRNTDLINNTGTAISSSMISVSDPTAAEVMSNGDIKSLQDNKKVTITATWGSVTTTTTLTTHLIEPIASFENPTITANVGDDITNTFTKTTGGAVTFESTSTSVATVDPAIGKVTIVGGGATVIKAIIAAEAPYKAKTVSYTLFVNYTPTGVYATETFKNMAIYSTTTTTTIIGDNGVDQWYLKNVRRLDNNDNYKIEGKYCPRIEYLGCIASKDTLEGGIKDVSFDWKAFNTSIKTHFRVIVDTLDNAVENVYECAKGATPSGKQTYAHAFNVERNVKLYIQMDANHENAPYYDVQQTYPVIGDLRITPYLLYTNKDTAVYMKDSKTYTNPGLINNTGATPSYSISCGADTAEINPNTGEVTIKKSAIVTVKATWGNVSTTYRLTMHAKNAPTITFEDQVVDMNQAPFAPAPTEAPAGIGTPSYSSTDKSVVKVNSTTGELTIVGQGYATINVHYTEGDDWAAADVSYKVTVTDAVGEGFVEETFTKDVIESKAAKDTIEGNIADWEYKFIRRDTTQAQRPDTLRCGQRASRLQDVGGKYDESYLLTTEPLEGGIKRVSFLWNNGSPFNSRDHNFIVIAGNDKDTVKKTIVAPDKDIALAVKDTIYNHNFLIKKNVTLSIRNNSGCYALIGNVKVTPYLSYTCKDTTIKAINFVGKTFKNDKFINNIGSEGTITYSIDDAASKAAIATIDENSGVVSILGGGEVKVIATWSKGATTSYNLTIEKETPTIEKFYNKEYDIFGTYSQDAIYAKIGETTIENPEFEYEVEDTKIATVKDGKIIFKKIGETNVKCTLKEGTLYKSVSQTKYLHIVKPTAGAWNESFTESNLEKTDGYNTATESHPFDGKNKVMTWQVRNYQFSKENKDKVNGEDGIRIKKDDNTNNYIATKSPEGGVKSVFFNWRMPMGDDETKKDANFTISVGSTTLATITGTATKDVFYSYYKKDVNCTTNGMFKVTINANNKATIFGPITIVPYLLYTKKDTTIKVLEYNGIKTFTNDKLINNTGVESGGDGITYSIKSVTPAGAAEILPENAHNGQVTIKGAGTAVVQAKWGDVTTTYTLNISGGELNLSFARNHIDTTMNAETFTNELSGVKSGAGALTYTSSNVRVAKVDNNGVVSAMGPGDATITANVAKGTIYKATSASFTVHVDEVSDPEEELIEEKFPDYAGSPWTTIAQVGPDTVVGDLGDWELSYARHAEKDSISINERAVWFNSNGYIRTLSIEGGIKRVKFNYNKVKTGNNFSVIAGNIKDTISVKSLNHTYTYNHNLFLKHNDTLKIHNITSGDLLVGTIIITPYLYYSVKADTIKLADHQKSNYDPTFLINNTNGGTITYSSSNPTVATVTDGGSVKPLKASAEPVIITAKWKSSDTDSVTTSFSLLINDKDARSAWFSKSKVNVERGETPDNTLNIPPVQDDTVPAVIYVSSNTAVAKIDTDKKTVLTVGPGTTTITAQISETGRCLAGEASYTLTVTYTPEPGTFWKETFSDAGNVTSSTTSKTIKGDDSMPNKWTLTTFMRHPDDTVGAERGIRVQYSGSIASNVALEGGVKEVVFNWRPLNTAYDTYFYVQVGDSTHNIFLPQVLDATKVIPYAHSFGDYGKSNTSLKIGNYASGVPVAHGHPVVGELKVIPYLLYTRKDTTVVVSEMASPNFKFFNNKWINNTDEGTISYTVLPKDNAVVMDGDSVKIIGEGTDTIQASWEGVTTTYVIHAILEDANLNFAKQDSTVLIGAGSCTQVATTKSSATIKYEFEGAHDGAEIAQDGTVTFSKTGEFHILATVPVDLPYNLDSARYTLTVNNKPTPEVEFKDTTVDMNKEPFTNPAIKIPASDMGQAHYSSDDVKIATVEELTGLITVIGEGTATISVHYDEGEGYVAADASFKVTVTDPADKGLLETFTTEKITSKAAKDTIYGVVADWEYKYIRRDITQTTRPDTLRNGKRASRLQDVGGKYDESYLLTTQPMEGGIKRVSFLWNNGSPFATRDHNFIVIAGNVKDTVIKTVTALDKDKALAAEDIIYNHNFLLKENATLSVRNNSGCYALIGDIKITPYLLYTTKKDTLDMKEKKTYQMVPQIDNRDDEVAIQYSFVEQNVDFATIDPATGEVTATAGGVVTVKAAWGDVYTTYQLTILNDQSIIYLMRNDGSGKADTIVNKCGEVAPTITLPTREGYQFNAYWTKSDTAKGSYRFTVTTAAGATVWVSNRTINKEKVTGDDRVWIYAGSFYTLYADWRTERTITLDNQEATEAGTDKVVTAYCPNNNMLRLTTSITCPTKLGYVFQGYYTQQDGGTQLIDANGAFIKSVEQYTDSNKWFIKDADITLYAHWTEATEITLNEEADNSGLISAVAGKTVKVNLTRTLAAGKFNTFCVPFDVTMDQLEEALGGEGNITRLATLDEDANATLDDSHKNLNIVIKDAESIEAGKPYLLWLENEVENPTFSNVTISTENEGISSKDNKVTFYGITSRMTIGKDDKSILFVSKNKLNWNGTGKDSDMKGLRAYFEVPGMNSGSGVAPRLVFRQPSAPTELMQNAECTMQGVQKVIINEQIYIIRNGVRYNLNGQIAK